MPLLDYIEAAALLNKYGIRSIDSSYVESAEDAVRFAGGRRIVLKLISNKALHKSKAGLVKLDLGSEDEIRKAFDALSKKGETLKPYKIIAQEMAKQGVEIIIGSNVDKQFGKMLLLGLGGIYVETFKDFSLRVCPISSYDAESMIDQLKSKDIVTYSGKAKGMLKRLLLSMSRFVEDNDFDEIDLNPVIIREDGYDLVDIRILKGEKV
ncbi:MAG: acetate--CoA ligase family protein [Candidatus Micrarchaeia archaeon]